MVPTSQWLIRWGCLALIGVGTLMQMVGTAAPYWIRDQARSSAYPAFVQLLRQAGVDPEDLRNVTKGRAPGVERRDVIRRAGADVGLWKWCVEIQVEADEGSDHTYRACHSPGISEFPGWWRGSQAMSMVGTLMGLLACVCGGLELYYLRRGVRFSGLIVLCSICCFVAALAIGISHGMFSSKYTQTLITILRLPTSPGWQGIYSLYPPILGWAFGVGAAGAVLIGSIGIALLAVITRTYPAYHRAENVVV